MAGTPAADYKSATWRQLLLRRKRLDLSPSSLARKLTWIDLTLLGMGATLGAGAYVLVGVVSSKTGPAVIVSFFVSGVASILSALCYAEFGARVPRAGSAYVYSYVTVGEVLAWTTGWQLLLEYVIGASSVARAWSGYVDSVANSAISTWMNAHVGNWTVPGLASYPDFLAFGMTMALSLVCAAGVRESTLINNVLTCVNVGVILLVVFAGIKYTNTANFSNFTPFGVKSIFDGAATSFFSYVGFDVIATSAEEAINPSRAIPLSIVLSLTLCMGIYMSVAAVFTLMVRYDDPTGCISSAPLSDAFGCHGVVWAQTVIKIGAVCGLTTSLMTSIFPMGRIVYAICSDGLLPDWIGAVNKRLGTPVVALLICGLLAGGLALIFDLTSLADMMSIGTLLSYTLVAASVLVLRYRQFDEERRSADMAGVAAATLAAAPPDLPLLLPRGPAPAGAFLLLPRVSPTGDIYMWRSAFSAYAAAAWQLAVFVVGSILLCVSVMSVQNYSVSATGDIALYIIAGVGGIVCAYATSCLYMLPYALPRNLAFTTPCMPGLALASIVINTYLLVSLAPATWVRFAVWCLIGTIIYLGYGVWHSRTPVDDGAPGKGYYQADGGEEPAIEAEAQHLLGALQHEDDAVSPTGENLAGGQTSVQHHRAVGTRKLL